MVRVEVQEARELLSTLVDRAHAGESVVIERFGRPVARLVAIETSLPVSEAFGAMRGEILLADDFDSPASFDRHFS